MISNTTGRKVTKTQNQNKYITKAVENPVG